MTDELRPYTPTLDERIKSFVAKSLYGEGRNALYKAEPINNAIGLSPVGILTSAYDSGRQIGSGLMKKDPGEITTGLAALGLSEAPEIGSLLKSVVKKYGPKVPWEKLGAPLIEKVWRNLGVDTDVFSKYYQAKEAADNHRNWRVQSDKLRESDLGKSFYENYRKLANTPGAPHDYHWHNAVLNDTGKTPKYSQIGSFVDKPVELRHIVSESEQILSRIKDKYPTFSKLYQQFPSKFDDTPHIPIIPYDKLSPSTIEKVWKEHGADDLSVLDQYYKQMDKIREKSPTNKAAMVSEKELKNTPLGQKYDAIIQRFMKLEEDGLNPYVLPTYKDWRRSVSKSGLDPETSRIGEFIDKNVPHPPERDVTTFHDIINRHNADIKTEADTKWGTLPMNPRRDIPWENVPPATIEKIWKEGGINNLDVLDEYFKKRDSYKTEASLKRLDSSPIGRRFRDLWSHLDYSIPDPYLSKQGGYVPYPDYEDWKKSVQNIGQDPSTRKIGAGLTTRQGLKIVPKGDE